MPVKNLIKYYPLSTKIESEEDILRLLRDVKTSIGSVIGQETAEKFKLKDILEIVMKGKYESGRTQIPYEIDLSAARELIEASYGGCSGCRHYKMARSVPEHIGIYCGKHESEADVDSELGLSPRMISFMNTGSTDKEPRLMPLEQIIAKD